MHLERESRGEALQLVEALEPQMRAGVAASSASQVAANLLSFLGSTLLLAAAAQCTHLVTSGRMEVASAGLVLVFAGTFPSAMMGIVLSWGTLESSLVSVARVVDFSALPSEAAEHAKVMPQGGPITIWVNSTTRMPASGSAETKRSQARPLFT
jgi:ABC-type multidrug transport system fused ATPase/permease subunit